MYERLLTFLRCPRCGGTLDLEPLTRSESSHDEIEDGVLHCQDDHWYPVAGGIPRMLTDALDTYWPSLEPLLKSSASERASALLEARKGVSSGRSDHDRRTQANFDREWKYHELGDRTWTMELDDRVKWFFLNPIRIPPSELEGKLLLDAGCGNGSQSVAYTEHGVEVIAVDISRGVELGHVFRHRRAKARPDKIHFVQADLQAPPFGPNTFDIIHSTGVLQATPNTELTFRTLSPLLRPGGTCYVWLLKYEPVVTPVVNTIRRLTTRIPSDTFTKVASVSAPAFQVFCRVLDRLGVRRYPRMSRREAALALLDIFGTPYAHAHSFPEVERWYRDEGFDEIWSCNEDRRGFGTCGRKAVRTAELATDGTAQSRS